MSAAFQAPAFTDENAAREAMEAISRPHGACCPRCGSLDRISKLAGKAHRSGLYYCAVCKCQFNVTVGTIFERSKVPLSKWWLAVHLLASSKKGMSSHQLMRMPSVTYQTAWFMTHRIREAMRSGLFSTPMGGAGAIVEVDETFIGNKKDMPEQCGYAHKHAVLTLVERGKGSRSFHVAGISAADVMPILKANIAKETQVMTDEAGQYASVKKHFAGHDFTRHGPGKHGRGESPHQHGRRSL